MMSIVESEHPKASKVAVDIILDKRLKGKVSLAVLEAVLRAMYPSDAQKQEDMIADVLVENKYSASMKRYAKQLAGR